MDDTDYQGSRLKPGATLDRYELLCPLASGGMATVWLARMRGKRGFEKLLAVKTILAELSDDPHFEEMFLDEARLAAQIQHPNVAQIIDLGEQDETLYLVMEWVDGEALSKIRRFAGKKGVQLPLGLALRVIADACAGLHAAHELRGEDGQLLGVVHRDVSPQNILVSTAGAVKVIDFGVAKATGRMAPQTRSGIIKGKLQYMAPEQALGKAIDRRVDVWALGVCLYELIADKLPFDGDNQLEILQRLNVDEPPAPLEGAVPAVVDEIVAKALARNPDDRYQTCAAMRRALEAAIAELELPHTNEDLAAFVAEHLPDRAAKRQELVARALKDASVRSGSIAIVQQGDAGAFDGTVEVDVRNGPPSGPTSGVPTRVTRAVRRKALALAEDDEPPASVPSQPSHPSQPSSATLASAAVESKIESRKELLAAIPRSRSGTWVTRILVAALAAAGLLGWQFYRDHMGATLPAGEGESWSASSASENPLRAAAPPPSASSAAPSAPSWTFGHPPAHDAGGFVPIPMAASASASKPTPEQIQSAIAPAPPPPSASAPPAPPPSASAPPAASAAPPASAAPAASGDNPY